MNEPDVETISRDETKRPCPNPRCGGLVEPEQESCTVCGDKLGSCPSCGTLISITIGRCGRCGYRTKGASAEKPKEEMTAPVLSERPESRSAPSRARGIFHFEKSPEEIANAVADAYRDAVLAGAEMVRATPILERARLSLLTEPDALRTWRLLDAEIGAADPGSVRPVLMSLRNWFTAELFAQQIRLLREAFERDEEAGWRHWLRDFAEALGQWRTRLCRALVEADLPFPKSFQEPYDFRRAMRLVLDERWPETSSFWTFLAGYEWLPAITRARLLITAGEIHLYYFSPPEKALRFFEQAQRLAPDLGRVLVALGDYHADQGDSPKAKGYFKRAIEAAPGRFEPYCSLGDLAQKESRFTEAESWYLEAIAKSGGDNASYTRLLGLYGQPSLIEKYETFIEPLAESAKAVEPADEYQIYLYVAAAYKTGQRFEQAHVWYDKAIASQPDRLTGYTWKGFACLEEGEGRYEEARVAFLKAIEVAPESYSGYWGLGQLFERQERWAEAATQYALAGQRQPEMEASMRARVGEMQWKLGTFKEAEATLLAALQLDPTADLFILGVVDDYLEKLGRPQDALRLLDAIRKIKGEGYEASYQNRLGNIYYHLDQEELAVQHYLRAIDLEPQQPIYFTNLSGAYKQLKRWEEARAQLLKALELDGNKQAFDGEAATIYNLEGNDYFARGEFDQAIDCYADAIRLIPGNPRYFSNRALAFERAMQTSAQPAELLDRAIADAQSASRLAVGAHESGLPAKEFAEHVQALEQRRIFLTRYGAAALSLRPTPHVIRVELPIAALPLIMGPEMLSLSKDSLDWIAAMRSAVRSRFGFTLPGINFTDLPGSESTSVDWRIEIMGEEIARARIYPRRKFAIPKQSLEHFRPETFPESAWLKETEWADAMALGKELIEPRDYLIRSLEGALTQNLGKLCGFDAMASALDQCAETQCALVRDDPDKLVQFTRIQRKLLIAARPMADLAGTCRDVAGDNNSAQGFQPAAMTSFEVGINSIAVRLGGRPKVDLAQLVPAALARRLPRWLSPSPTPDLALLPQVIAGLQSLLFEKLGVIIPQITIEHDQALGPSDFQLQLDSQRLPVAQRPAEGEIWVPVSFDDIRDQFPDGRAANGPSVIGQGTILKDTPELRQKMEESGRLTFGPTDFLAYYVGAELMAKASQFLTRDLTEFWLSELKTNLPVTVSLARRFLGVEAITQLLRETLDRKGPIRALPRLLTDFLA